MTDPTPSANLARATAFFRDLADIVARRLQDRAKMSSDQATAMAFEISQDVCKDHAGTTIYVPTSLNFRIDERDRELHAAYVASGRNVHAMTKQFGISAVNVYRRVKIVEDELNARDQGTLFQAD